LDMAQTRQGDIRDFRMRAGWQYLVNVGTVGYPRGLVEIKRRDKIGEEIVSEVRERLRKLKVKRGISVIPVLVCEGTLSKRIAADGFFPRIVSAEELLGREQR